MKKCYKLEVYIPESHLEVVKDSMFNAGAGRIGDYDRCCWQLSGQGQFRALEGSNPFLGEQGELETVTEYKVELVCSMDCIGDVVLALKKAHPYETPAYQYWEVSV